MASYSDPESPIASVKRYKPSPSPTRKLNSPTRRPRCAVRRIQEDDRSETPPPGRTTRRTRLRNDDERTTLFSPPLQTRTYSLRRRRRISNEVVHKEDLLNSATESDENCAQTSDSPEEKSDEEESDSKQEQRTEFNQYLFMKNLPPYENFLQSKRVYLPPRMVTRNSPITLVLDLDETLVHCSIEPIPRPDIEFSVTFNSVDYKVRVKKRPYLDHFLATVSKSFEVVIFTASQPVYANKLLDELDPDRQYVKHRLFRDACLEVGGSYLKDLSVLGRDLSRVVIVDNSPHVYGYQIDNGIPIESWFDDDSDTELLKLIKFLKTLDGVSDVRDVVRSHFKTFALVENAHV